MTAGDPEFPYRAAGDFLQLCATVLQAFAWARSARCIQALPVGSAQRREKQESGGFFFSYLLPDLDRQVAAIDAAATPLPFIAESF